MKDFFKLIISIKVQNVVGNALTLVVKEIFEVLYNPVKAFRKIIEKPDFRGVILVLVLVVSSMVVVQYVASSKLFLENRAPENDEWTESLANQHNWLSNGSPVTDGADYKMGNEDGNNSIASSLQSESIWMQLTDIDTIDVSEETGYTELCFWIKWSSEDGISPSSGTLKLFSGNEDSYFEASITNFLTSNGEWANATLEIGPNTGWASYNSPNWQTLTGIEFNLTSPDSANLTMKIDGLFFRKFSSPVYSGEFGSLILPIIIEVALTFAINWILWSGILLIVGKLFHVELGRWSVFFIIVGYIFITTFVYTLVSAVPLSTLPPLEVPLDAEAFNSLLSEVWSPLMAYQVWVYLPLIGEVWIAALGAVVIHIMKEAPWSKATTIAAVAFGIRFLLRLVLGV